MAIRGGYAPPGVYTESTFESPTPQVSATGRLPLFIGSGKETFSQSGLTLVRGSSSTVDQSMVEEDASGRVVLSTNPDGSFNLGDYDGLTRKVRTRQWPLVTGDGTGTTTTSAASVVAQINGNVVVVIAVDGADGIVTLSQAPKPGDDVRISYFFNRKDSLVSAESLSAQVSTSTSDILAANGSMEITPTSRSFLATVDGSIYTLTLPIKSDATTRDDHLSAIVSKINAAGAGTLVASTYTNNNGVVCLKLSADGSLVVGAGTANSALGLISGQAGSARTSVFYTAYSPIVDGSDGGVTTTDVSDVNVLVDNVKVAVTSVDGATGAVTLANAPKVGADVVISYYYNSFRDQYDFIPARNVVSVDRVALVPDATAGASSIFLEGVSWILRDDKIYWGTAALAGAGDVQLGDTSFGATQINPVLKDERAFMLECAPVVSGLPPRVSTTTFTLPYQPMDGSGTATPTHRPDLVTARVGVSISDALANPAATVVRVNPANSTITLSSPVNAGEKVYATFYYNEVQDSTYDFSVASVGGSTQGTYSISKDDVRVLIPSYVTKGTALSTTTISFPSGSELVSDVRLSAGNAVEELVTLEFANFEPTPAIYTSKGAGSYALVEGASDTIELDLGVDSKTISLENPLGVGYASLATLVSAPLPYLASTDSSVLSETPLAGDLFLSIDGEAISVDVVNLLNATAGGLASVINDAAYNVPAKYTAMGVMAPFTLIAASHDTLTIRYVGSATGAIVVSCTVPANTYLTSSDLASAVETALQTAIDASGDATVANFLDVNVSSSEDRLVFSLAALGNGDTYGYIEFIAQTAGNETADFCIIAGIDADIANGAQTKWGILPIAYAVSTDLSAAVGSDSVKDRLVLRNRTLAGDNYYAPITLGVEVVGGTLLESAGLTTTSLVASKRSVIEPASLRLVVGWDDQDDLGSTQSTVKFYDGTDALYPANNVLSLDVGGEILTVEFAASATGTTTVLGANTGVGASIEGQINTQLIALGVTAVVEGANIRILNSGDPTSESYIRVLDGSANSVFGLTEGRTTTARLVSASALASAINNHYTDNDPLNISDWLFATGADPDSYADRGIAYASTNSVGQTFVTFEDLNTGVASYISFTGGNALTTKGSGLQISVGDGAVGEAAYQGFFVTSTNVNGSGSANTSTLNDGAGQDGVVGQTYVDAVTGLTFTILARDGGVSYPTGADATLTYRVSKTAVTNANIPLNVIPGVQLFVANTTGTSIGDTAVVETFNKGGSEPDIGQVYYLDVTTQKANFNTGVFTRITDVVAAFGDVGPENPLAFAAYIAFTNGANAVALKQVPLLSGESDLTTAQVIDTLASVEGEIAPDLLPSVIVPLIPASALLLAELSKHCDLQSSLRYRAERTSIAGCPAGTTPEEAVALAASAKNSRVRLIYPDIVSVTYTNTIGVTQTAIVDGRYFAVALAAMTTTTSTDSATPWTNRTLSGFGTLLRTLDAVDSNKTANGGVTVLQQTNGALRVRHGLTTDMTSVLTRTPTVMQIADDVHFRARNLLANYIGIKYLPTVVGQIEGRVNQMFKDLVKEQIISSYTGLTVTEDPQDPTGLLVNVYYKPVFPLLYIQFTFNVRASN